MEPATPPPADPTNPAAPAPPPPADPAVLTELQSLRTFKAQMEAERVLASEKQRLAEQEELKRKGQFDELARTFETALEAERRKGAEILDRARKAELSRSLSSALTGYDLVEGAVEDLQALWGSEFEVEDAPDGSFRVRSKADLRDPKAVVAERLASKRFAHFLKATGRGGTGGAGGSPAPSGGTPAEQQFPTVAARLAAGLKGKYQSN